MAELKTLAGGDRLRELLMLGLITPAAQRSCTTQVEIHLVSPEPANLAGNDAVVAKLWRKSATMADLPGEVV